MKLTIVIFFSLISIASAESLFIYDVPGHFRYQKQQALLKQRQEMKVRQETVAQCKEYIQRQQVEIKKIESEVHNQIFKKWNQALLKTQVKPGSALEPQGEVPDNWKVFAKPKKFGQ